MNHELAEVVRIAPEVWPGEPLYMQPGNLAQFVPSGLGLGVPAVMSPWDNLEDLGKRGGFYAFSTPSIHPFLNAPTNDACAGVVYFNGRATREQFDSLLRLLEVQTVLTDYAAFWRESGNPVEERYLEQLRIVSRGALVSIFNAETGEQQQVLFAQTLPVKDALWAFLENQQTVWSRNSLRGKMGGDGDWAKETLGFGFMVENSYHAVYRLWSRAWLLTK